MSTTSANAEVWDAISIILAGPESLYEKAQIIDAAAKRLNVSRKQIASVSGLDIDHILANPAQYSSRPTYSNPFAPTSGSTGGASGTPTGQAPTSEISQQQFNDVFLTKPAELTDNQIRYKINSFEQNRSPDMTEESRADYYITQLRHPDGFLYGASVDDLARAMGVQPSDVTKFLLKSKDAEYYVDATNNTVAPGGAGVDPNYWNNYTFWRSNIQGKQLSFRQNQQGETPTSVTPTSVTSTSTTGGGATGATTNTTGGNTASSNITKTNTNTQTNASLSAEIANQLGISPPEELVVYLTNKLNEFGVQDRKSTRLNSSHSAKSRMPSSA